MSKWIILALLIGCTLYPEAFESHNFQYGQTVKIIDKESIFAGCIGKIADADFRHNQDDRGYYEYKVKVLRCPYDNDVKDKIAENQTHETLEALK